MTLVFENYGAASEEDVINVIRAADADTLAKIAEHESNTTNGPREPVIKALQVRRDELANASGNPTAQGDPDQGQAPEGQDGQGTDTQAQAPEGAGSDGDPTEKEHKDLSAQTEREVKVSSVGDPDHEPADPEDLEIPDVGGGAQGDATQLTSAIAALRGHESEEPWEGYHDADEDELKTEFDNRDTTDLTKALNYELENEQRDGVIEDLKSRLNKIKSSLQEVWIPHDPRQQQELLKDHVEGEDGYGKGPAPLGDLYEALEESDAQPFDDDTLRRRTEEQMLSGDTGVKRLANAKYLVERDPVEAAQFQEGLVSASPDDVSQREALAAETSQALRVEAAFLNRNMSETNSSQHQAASVAAENGEVWPPQHATPAEYVEARNARDKDAREWQKKRAQAIVARLNKNDGGPAVVPEAAEDRPLPPGSQTEFVDPKDPDSLELLVANTSVFDESLPQTSGIGICAAVSRRDEHHDKIGIVTDVDDQPHTGLVEVTFPGEEPQWLNILNIRYEGDGLAVLAREAAAAA